MRKNYVIPLICFEVLSNQDVLNASNELNGGKWEIGEAPIFE